MVPEGVNTAIVVYGNTIDQVLEKLRKAESPLVPQSRAVAMVGEGGSRKEVIESLKSHLRQMISVIQSDMAKVDKVAAKGTVDEGSLCRYQKSRLG